jgi:hypothetical protein
MANIMNADAQELGAAVDMIKDLSEAIYYCTITESMEKGEKEREKHYPEPYPMMYYSDRDMDRKEYGRMYYDANNSGMTRAYNPIHTHTEREMPIEMRDVREGRSPITRKTYMEAKEKYHDKNIQMKELEKYMQELSSDIVEMIEGASHEEKQYLSSRIAALANKING